MITHGAGGLGAHRWEGGESEVATNIASAWTKRHGVMLCEFNHVNNLSMTRDA